MLQLLELDVSVVPVTPTSLPLISIVSVCRTYGAIRAATCAIASRSIVDDVRSVGGMAKLRGG
ncbi:hypothetical protein WPS_12790 [Vulcanimicrobium alpinum]|uniref:Uncharacterized protein n=1 Tax=Vulcanimicrobium alpinum TaxID=3016050 RepID=A0AAN1XV34_UNVUL|nr:hypothetical protein WPS_12790 [Vulcanimicrobium alpinum]